jgi:hypothetical protein
MMNKFYFIVISLLFGCFAYGQNSLLDEITTESDYENTFEMPAFKAMKVVNNQSTKLAGKGDLYLYVGHRFGAIKGGIESLFGLDYANTKIEMLYGLLNEVQVGFSAGSLDFSFGKIINSMSVNNQEIEFNTASLNLSIITTDGSPKGEKNYFNLYGGINLISDFEDTNYMNFVIGLNYHIRFNRKLNKSDKTYLSKF